MFLDELNRAIERISKHPRQFSAYEFGTRRMVLGRFPYLVVFRETAPASKSLLWFTDVAAALGGDPRIRSLNRTPLSAALPGDLRPFGA